LFQNLADFANGTPLKEVVGTSKDLKQGDAPGESSLLAAQNVAGAQNESTIRKYQQDILRHAEEWQDTVTSQVDEKVAEYKTLKREYFHYNFKTAKLRRRAHIADSWNIQLVSNMLSKKSSRNESKMEVVVKKYKEKTNEICFLLEQVTNHGWKDLYPLVESTIEWEIDRLSKEQEPYGTVLIATLDKMKLEIAILEEEETAPSRSFHGTSECIENADALSLQIDPSKPTLFLDDACPFTARVWITLLEKEADPFNPTGFHVIPVCTANSQDPGLSLLKSLGMDASPVLVHNGNVFSESTRVAEYIDKAFRHPLYHSIPPLRPNSPIDVFNMKTFMKRHSKIAEVFYNLMDSDDESSRLIDEDLRKFQGPYFCGQQCTLAAVSLFPFVEHIKIILASFGATVIPESLTSLPECI
jgi:glutathione S-transferase